MSRKEPSANDVIRVGRISAVYPERHTATVQFSDRSGIITKELPVMACRTLKNKFYHMPDENEQAVCAFYGNGLSEGVIIGSVYSENKQNPEKSIKPPADDRDLYGIWFRKEKEDPPVEMSFSRADRVLNIDFPKDREFDGSVRVRARRVEVADAEEVKLTFDDGASIIYDARSHALNVNVCDEPDKRGSITLRAHDIYLSGAVHNGG